MAQLAPLNGMVAGDFNNDGNLDVAISGNDYGNEVSAGRYDAMNGIVLLGEGNGNFKAQTILQSGLFINGDGKSLIGLQGVGNNYFLAATQNRGALKLFKMRKNDKIIKANATDAYAIIQFKNGKTRKQEFYYGTSYLSQSSRFLNVDENTVNSLRIFNNKGESRTVIF